jgi:hypothetical protein
VKPHKTGIYVSVQFYLDFKVFVWKPDDDCGLVIIHKYTVVLDGDLNDYLFIVGSIRDDVHAPCLSVSYVCKPLCYSYWTELDLIQSNLDAVSGLAKLEGEMIDCDYDEISKDICTKYQLTGIVVHSGQASGGHYYSYILHR